MRLPRNFVPAGSFTAAVLVGALNAVDAPRECRHWEKEYLSITSSTAAFRDASEGWSAGLLLVRMYGRRAAKRAIVRCSREHRFFRRWARDRGDHIVGRGAANTLRDYRVWSPVPRWAPEGVDFPRHLVTVKERDRIAALYGVP